VSFMSACRNNLCRRSEHLSFNMPAYRGAPWYTRAVNPQPKPQTLSPKP